MWKETEGCPAGRKKPSFRLWRKENLTLADKQVDSR